MPSTAETIQLLEESADPTLRQASLEKIFAEQQIGSELPPNISQAFLEKILAEQKAELERQADQIRLLRQAIGDPTPLQAIVEKTLAEQQAQLKRQANQISLLKAERDRLKEAMREMKEGSERDRLKEAMREMKDEFDHQLSVLAGQREILARHTFEGVIRAVTDTDVEISVEAAAETNLLRIAKERFAPGHVLVVGDHVTVDNFCTRAPQAGSAPDATASVQGQDELASLVEGLRRRSSRGPTQL